MKVQMFSFFPAQIPYLGMFWLLGYNVSQNALNEWDSKILESSIIQERKWMNKLDFGHDDIDSRNTKDGLYIFS